MRSVTYAELAVWLDYTVDNLRKFVGEGLLDQPVKDGVVKQTDTSISRLLLRFELIGGATRPTFDDFALHGMRLVGSRTAANILQITPTELRNAVKRGELPALELNGQYRFVEADLRNLKAKQPRYVTYQQVLDIVGCSVKVGRRYIAAGLLKPVKVILPPDHPPVRYTFSFDSLVATVAHLLVPHARDRAEAWVTNGLKCKRWALVSTAAMHELGITESRDWAELVDKEELIFLGLEGEGQGKRSYSAHDILRLFLAQATLTPAEIAATLDWEQAMVESWLPQACPLHDHTHGLLYRHACLVASLPPWLSPRTPVHRFLDGRSKGANQPLMSVERAANRLATTVENVVWAVEGGALRGLRRPDGTWGLVTSSVMGISQSNFALLVEVSKRR